jgi:RimJ/RimL family protein N-acetyltransferase
MTEPFTIREARRADAASLSAFVARLIAERLPVIFRRDRGPTEDEEREFIDKIASAPRSVLFVAEAKGSIVGMLDFHGEQRAQREHSGGFGMSVARQWRRAGIGTKLIESLIVWAEPHGIRRIELEVFSNNHGAIALYRKAGFQLEGTKVRAVAVDGEYIDVLQMARLL